VKTVFEAANAAADRVAINAIVDEAADATTDRVAVNATIVNVAAHAVTGQVAAISDEEAERGAGADRHGHPDCANNRRSKDRFQFQFPVHFDLFRGENSR